MIACYNSNNNNNKRRKLHRILRTLVVVWHVFDALIDIKKLVCFEFRMSILRYFMCIHWFRMWKYVHLYAGSTLLSLSLSLPPSPIENVTGDW